MNRRTTRGNSLQVRLYAGPDPVTGKGHLSDPNPRVVVGDGVGWPAALARPASMAASPRHPLLVDHDSARRWRVCLRAGRPRWAESDHRYRGWLGLGRSGYRGAAGPARGATRHSDGTGPGLRSAGCTRCPVGERPPCQQFVGRAQLLGNRAVYRVGPGQGREHRYRPASMLAAPPSVATDVLCR